MGIFDSIPTHMDYQGQKLSEQIFQVFAVTFGLLGFIVGYVFQQLSYTMYVLGAGCLLGCLITIPPWPMYRRNPVSWQKPKSEDASTQESKSFGTKSGKKKQK